MGNSMSSFERKMLYAIAALIIAHIVWPGIHNKPTWPSFLLTQ